MWRSTEYSATSGIRQLPEICWYLAKRVGKTHEFEVAPRIKRFYSSLTDYSVKDVFCCRNEENGHDACISGHLTNTYQGKVCEAKLALAANYTTRTTANQSRFAKRSLL